MIKEQKEVHMKHQKHINQHKLVGTRSSLQHTDKHLVDPYYILPNSIRLMPHGKGHSNTWTEASSSLKIPASEVTNLDHTKFS